MGQFQLYLRGLNFVSKQLLNTFVVKLINGQKMTCMFAYVKNLNTRVKNNNKDTRDIAPKK